MSAKSKTVFFAIFILLIVLCALVYAFIANEVTKIDVSESFIVPENYENLLVLDVTIPSSKNLKKDNLLHNGQASSTIGDMLKPFSSNDWYSDNNLNQMFDGNQTASDNEAIIYSFDDILDANDLVKNSGTAFIKSFRYSSGIYE
ncbi:MAG: hypothetical protein ACPL7B_04810, partial [Candidatus Poribacteria bacterium]